MCTAGGHRLSGRMCLHVVWPGLLSGQDAEPAPSKCRKASHTWPGIRSRSGSMSSISCWTLPVWRLPARKTWRHAAPCRSQTKLHMIKHLMKANAGCAVLREGASSSALAGDYAVLAPWLALQQVQALHAVAFLPAGSPLSSASLASGSLSAGGGTELPLSSCSLPLSPSSAGRGLSLPLRASSLCCRQLTGAAAPPRPSRASSLPCRAASSEQLLPVAGASSGGSLA